MSLRQLEIIRRFELRTILDVLRRELPAGARVLDIGAGTGWQARSVADAGFKVQAVDMTSSAYAGDRVFPIHDYDGHAIPFPDATFDAVYSSNVLEHVAHADAFQKEILRVLKPGGVAVHIVPSGSWRFWSNLAHYPYMLKAIVGRLLRGAPDGADVITSASKEPAPRTVSNTLRRLLVPNRDGEVGNALTEIWHFSRWRWSGLFRRNGWNVESRRSNGLFYTAYYVLGPALPMFLRRGLSSLTGGSCHVFVLRTTAPASRSEGNRQAA